MGVKSYKNANNDTLAKPEQQVESSSPSSTACSKDIPYKYMDVVQTLSTSSKGDICRVARARETKSQVIDSKEIILYDCGCIIDVIDNKMHCDCRHCLLGQSIKNLKLNHAMLILQNLGKGEQ